LECSDLRRFCDGCRLRSVFAFDACNPPCVELLGRTGRWSHCLGFVVFPRRCFRPVFVPAWVFSAWIFSATVLRTSFRILSSSSSGTSGFESRLVVSSFTLVLPRLLSRLFSRCPCLVFFLAHALCGARGGGVGCECRLCVSVVCVGCVCRLCVSVVCVGCDSLAPYLFVYLSRCFLRVIVSSCVLDDLLVCRS
jgi:hypothetical protein